MQPLELAAACKSAVTRLHEGQDPHMCDGLLAQAAESIEQLVGQVRSEMARTDKYDEALQTSKRMVEDLRAENGNLHEVNERYGRMIDHLIDEG